MKKITLPKWTVVQTLDGGRLIHIGNGEFVSADAQTPKIIETCVPTDQTREAPTSVTLVDAPEYQLMWALGSLEVSKPEVAPEAPASAADAANAEMEAATTPAEEAK